MTTKSYDRDPSKILKRKHHMYPKESQRVFYIISLIVLIIASFIGSMVLIPLLLFFDKIGFLLVFTGLIFGMFFSYVVLDLQHVDKRHHTWLFFIIPVIAVLNVVYINVLAGEAAARFSIGFEHNPFILGIYYVGGFIVPYLITKLYQRLK